MKARWTALLQVLLVPTFLSAADPPRRHNSAQLTAASPGAFFAMNWGDDIVKSRENHCRSAPEAWIDQCRFNAQIVDRLSVRLQDVDWEALGRRADRRLDQIKRCFKGRPAADADGCYEDPASNIVTGHYVDQYGGRWRVEAARGVPSEGLFDGPLWANAVVESLGPIRYELDLKGNLASVASPRTRLAEAVNLEAAEREFKTLSK